MKQYVDQRNGGYYVAGTRISLDSIVYAFQNGVAPESIYRSFPMVGSLENVYGAITFYLSHKDAVDAFLRDQQRLWQELEAGQPSLPESLARKLVRAPDGMIRREH